jgi:tRNA nucleotidyltransferase (CCA-adding enzyme)
MNKIFRVGGSVRDTFLGVKSKDMDFAVEAPSFDSMRETIIALGGKIFLETPEFFTIRANVPALGSADYVLCRKDGCYTDGRRPESVTIGTIFDDLARRDFTMNAIAVNAANEFDVLDPHKGIEDITDRLIRCVGDPRVRFGEDALRVIRAIRFAITKGFRIERNTANAMHGFCCNYKHFANVSTERIREESLKMFAADTGKALRLLDEFDLFGLLGERGIWLKPTVEKV